MMPHQLDVMSSLSFHLSMRSFTGILQCIPNPFGLFMNFYYGHKMRIK